MATKEKREFEIKLQVKDKDGEVKVLKSKTFLEITWYGDKGILNPGELVNYDDEYGKGSYRESKGEKIRFEKDGKSYDIIIKINEIKKGWFKDKVVETGGFFPAPGSDFTIENNDKTQNWKIEPMQLRWTGPIWIAVFLIFLGIGIYLWKKYGD